MFNRWGRRTLWSLLLLVLMIPAMVVMAAYTGPTYTGAQIADAIRNSPNANTWLKQNAQAVANLAINVESGEIGIQQIMLLRSFLINKVNLQSFNIMAPQQYFNKSL